MRKLVITLVVLAAVLVVVDRVTHAAAQREVAHRVATAYDLPREPDAQIHGVPFLSQALRGHYRRIDLTTREVTVRDLDLRRLQVELRDVEAPLRALLRPDGATLRAASVTGRALVPFAEVQDRLPGEMEVQASGDALRLAGETMVLGRPVPTEAVVEVAVQEQAITFRPTRIQVDGRPVGPALRGRFTLSVPVDELPLGLRATDIAVTGNGVRLVATADDVELSRPTGGPPPGSRAGPARGSATG